VNTRHWKATTSCIGFLPYRAYDIDDNNNI